MRRNIFRMMIISIVCIWACSNSEEHLTQQGSKSSVVARIDDCEIPLELIVKEILGKKINEIGNIRNCYVIQDSLMQDEGESWPAKVYSRHDSLIFLAETNWIDRSTISRITIYSPFIRSANGVSVGKEFREIKALVSSTIPSVPDGYFALDDKNNPNISYMMDIEVYPELEDGLTDISEVPPNLVIKSIIILNSKKEGQIQNP